LVHKLKTEALLLKLYAKSLNREANHDKAEPKRLKLEQEHDRFVSKTDKRDAQSLIVE
jgi:hypothetical protein